ncbi:MAG TPA: hypothetical protein VF676_01045 [Flavobacterium sp.]|jgi:hypothetical protein
MDALRIGIAAFSATNVMTTFSYLLSVTYGSLFKEPVLLNFILDQMGFSIRTKWKGFTGWLAHYCIGLLFVISYDFLWAHGGVPFGWVSGIGFGIISGFIGILGWRLMFRLPDQKPDVPLNDYYGQLFFAHIIFAGAVVVAYKIYEYDPISHIAAATM